MSDEDPYTMRQDREDARYAKEYQAWIASLSPEEQRKVASMGIDKPDLARSSNGVGLSRDEAESSTASTWDPALGDIEVANAYAESSTEYTMEVIRKFLHELARQRNPSLTIECYMLVTGVAYSGDSMTDIAKRYGLTRAAVSKRCIELADMLGIHASRAMKSEDARKAYSTARKKSLQKSKI